MCGTTSPTKAMGPQAATAAPHSSVIAIADTSAGQVDLRPERSGRLLPERERVELAARPERDDEPDDDEREQLGGDAGVAPGQ